MASLIVVLPGEEVPGKEPAGDGEHVVRDGECISLLAAQRGLKSSDVFDHPANAALKALRPNLNVLLPRDRVAIRAVEQKDVAKPTNTKNVFALNDEPVFLRIQLLDRDQPVKNEPFTLSVGALKFAGVTEADGTIKVQVPPGATQGFLSVGPPTNVLQMNLKLGSLHPVESDTGVQQRLQNLGFDCGKIDGLIGPRTRGRIRDFQGKNGLLVNGVVTPETRNLLKAKHGC